MCASYLRVHPVAARRCCMFLKHSLSPSLHLKVCGAAVSYKKRISLQPPISCSSAICVTIIVTQGHDSLLFFFPQDLNGRSQFQEPPKRCRGCSCSVVLFVCLSFKRLKQSRKKKLVTTKFWVQGVSLCQRWILFFFKCKPNPHTFSSMGTYSLSHNQYLWQWKRRLMCFQAWHICLDTLFC